MFPRRALFILFWVAWAASSASTGLADARSPAPTPDRPLRVVMDNNYPPYVFIDASGSAQGILVDRWRLWEQKSGRRVELHPMDWGEALRRMGAGEFDVIDTIFTNPERARRYDFSKPYARLEVPVFFHRNISGITGAESLKGFAVGVKKGDAAVDFLKRHDVDQLLLFDSYEQIARAAGDGSVVVFVIDKPPALYYLYKLGIQDRFRYSPPLYVGEFHRAVRKGDTALLASVEAGFARISPREAEQIERRWYGTAPFRPSPYLKYLFAAMLAVSAAALALTAWNRMLRKSVEQRTKALREEMALNAQHVEALGQSEARFRSLAEKTPLPIAINDRQGRIEFLNDRFVSTFGYSRDDLHRVDDWWLLAYPDAGYRAEAIATWSRITGEAAARGTDIRPMEFRVACKGGEVRTVEIFGAGIGERFLVVFNDVTDRKALEEQLLQSRKMEAIGRLAGGVAHDFNNLLTVMIGYLGLVLNRTAPDAPHRTELCEVKKAAEQAAGLTQQLLAFSRKQVLDPKVADLNDLVRDAGRILSRLLGEDVEITTRLDGRPLPILADTGQVGQIIINLAVNARDAMPKGGRLTIETRLVEVDALFSREHPPLDAGPAALLSVADTGAGMDAETVSRIFEPFFTTKEVGKGTGLGLSSVYGTVAQSRGCITVESAPGHGTVFRVFFPAVDPPAEAGPVAPADKPDRGNETILVAEDEASVRELIGSVLAEEGYRVLAARDGREATATFRDHGESIDLLVTDVIMPGMNGRELADLLREQAPGLRVLFISGYPDDAIGRHGAFEEGTTFLPKPFTPEALARAVRTALDAAAARAAAGRSPATCD